MQRIEWATRLKVPVRLIALPIDGAKLLDQAKAIQQARPEVLETTVGAMTMLAHIAGRRVPRSISAAIPDAVIDTLRGQLDTEGGESQDLLAPTLGEMFGSLLFVLESGVDADVIRVMESPQQRNPDYLVVNPGERGLALSILECKGIATDLHAALARRRLDVCRRIWRRRREGIKQLNMPDSTQLGSKVVFRRAGARPSPLGEAVRAVSVTCTPDGRLLDHQAVVRPPDRRLCQSTNCVECSSAHHGEANLIVTLNKQALPPAGPIDHRVISLLRSYRSCDQALWCANPRHLGKAYSDLLRQSVGLSPGTLDRLSPLLLGPMARAGELGLPLKTLNVPLSEFPESFQREFYLLQQRLSTGPAHYRGEMKLADLARLPQLQMDSREWATGEMGYLIEDRWQDVGFSGTVRHVGQAVFDIRISPSDAVLGPSYYGSEVSSRMRDIVVQVVDTVRQHIQSPLSVHFEEASARFRDREFTVGEYWNRFPFAHQVGKLPGFTAWIAWDGRARVVCRFPQARSAGRGQ